MQISPWGKQVKAVLTEKMYWHHMQNSKPHREADVALMITYYRARAEKNKTVRIGSCSWRRLVTRVFH